MSGNCPDGFEKKTNGKCYGWATDNPNDVFTQPKAKDLCKSKGGVLPEVFDDADNDIVEGYISRQ